MFDPMRTDRLLIRGITHDDLDEFVARRNDPQVARYQDWELPYSRERGTEVISRSLSTDQPEDDQWWVGVVCHEATGEVLGDLVLHLTWAGRTAEIGYTFSREQWGCGYATEAADALVDRAFDTVGVTRVAGTLHPENVASAMVLERIGMLFEGHTRSSFWVGDELSDDWIYGMTYDDWAMWRERPRQTPGHVCLDEITSANQRRVASLVTHKSQERFVAPVSRSFGDALFPEIVNGAPLAPWMRVVLADGVEAGFVMLALPTEHHPEPYLWRLLIDRMHQRRGIGRRVLELVAEECRRLGAETLLTSWGEGTGSPAGFYLGYGFEPTGALVEGEVEARLRLAP